MSSAWVKAGALYSLDWDYEVLGRQCASVALQIIDGKDAGSIRPVIEDPRLYQLNLQTAKQLKIDVSSELIAGASEVYQ